MTDASTVVEDPMLDSLGAFLAASFLTEPARAEPPGAAPSGAAPSGTEPSSAEPSRAPLAEPPQIVAWPLPAAAPMSAIVATIVPALARAEHIEPVARSLARSEPDRIDPPATAPSRPSRVRLAVEWTAIIGGALLVAILIRVFVIQSFAIPSESMHPTLQKGDRVLVNRLAYRAHDIRRGDVIVFRRPAKADLGPDAPAHLIKRVIGLPGDTIVARNGIVYIDGRQLREPYVPAGTLTERLDSPVVIPAGHVWVMGDNRMDSTDSRVFGPIDIKLVVGRAFARVWPPSRIGFL